jgi:hypothetical protein
MMPHSSTVEVDAVGLAAAQLQPDLGRREVGDEAPDRDGVEHRDIDLALREQRGLDDVRADALKIPPRRDAILRRGEGRLELLGREKDRLAVAGDGIGRSRIECMNDAVDDDHAVDHASGPATRLL